MTAILIKFLTALAWLWGGVCFSMMVISLFRTPETSRARDAENFAWGFVYGIPAWAWLIARYSL